MKRVVIYILIMVSALAANAQQTLKGAFRPEIFGVTSLSIAPDARGASMGDMGVATDADANSQYWNCAKYPFNIARAGISGSYTPWLRKIVSGINLANISGFYRIGEYSAISGSLRYFGMGEVSTLDMGYTMRPYELAIDVAYSRMLSQTFSMGVALRGIFSNMNYDPSQEATLGKAFAADVTMYHQGYLMIGNRECALSWGLSLTNIGTKINMGNSTHSEFLPAMFMLGINMTVPINEYNRFSFGVEMSKPMVPTMPAQQMDEEGTVIESDEAYAKRLEEDYYSISSIAGIFKSWGDAPGGFAEEMKEFRWSFGAEYTYNDRFMLRAGYHYESPEKGNRQYATVGAGFKMSVFTIDAAYCIATAQGNPLDQTMRFSLGFDLDGMKDLFGKRR